jgi:hypothetical protein
MELESKEDILDIFSGIDEEFIFNVLLLICWCSKFREESELISAGISILLGNLKGFFLLGEFRLKLSIHSVESFSHSLWNLFTDFLTVFLLEFNTKLSEEFIEIFLRWVANGLGLLDKVILNFSFAVDVVLVGFFVHDHLSFLLIEESFSHVFVLFQSHGLLNELLDDFYKFFVGVLLINLSRLSFGFFLKLVFLIEKFFDVLFSDTSQIFIDLGFNLRFITKVVGVWV